MALPLVSFHQECRIEVKLLYQNSTPPLNSRHPPYQEQLRLSGRIFDMECYGTITKILEALNTIDSGFLPLSLQSLPLSLPRDFEIPIRVKEGTKWCLNHAMIRTFQLSLQHERRAAIVRWSRTLLLSRPSRLRFSIRASFLLTLGKQVNENNATCHSRR